MENKPGVNIPEDIISKRFRDKNSGYIFLELTEQPGLLVKVDEEDRFQYDIERSFYSEKDLELLYVKKKENISGNSENVLPGYLKPYLKKAFILKNIEGIQVYNDEYLFIGTIQSSDQPVMTKSSSFSSEADGEIDISGLKNGDLLPEKCRKNPLVESSPEKPAKILSPEAVVDILVEKLIFEIKANHISADYFIHKKLGPKNRQILVDVYNGHLDRLNEETTRVRKKILDRNIEAGFTLLKAALIHELYVNSTLAGRSAGEGNGSDTGKNMKGLLTFMNLLKSDGSLAQSKCELTIGEQQKLVDLFFDFSKPYLDKKEVIIRVYRKMKFDFKESEFGTSKEKMGLERFRALLIYKLYENTNRLDRGDGITMICLNRDIMDMNSST